MAFVALLHFSRCRVLLWVVCHCQSGGGGFIGMGTERARGGGSAARDDEVGGRGGGHVGGRSMAVGCG